MSRLGPGKTSAGLGGEESRAVSAEPDGQPRGGRRGSQTEPNLQEEEPLKPAWPEQADRPMLNAIHFPPGRRGSGIHSSDSRSPMCTCMHNGHEKQMQTDRMCVLSMACKAEA